MYYKENHKELYPCSASTLFFILFFTVYGMVNQIQNGKNRNLKDLKAFCSQLQIDMEHPPRFNPYTGAHN